MWPKTLTQSISTEDSVAWQAIVTPLCTLCDVMAFLWQLLCTPCTVGIVVNIHRVCYTAQVNWSSHQKLFRRARWLQRCLPLHHTSLKRCWLLQLLTGKCRCLFIILNYSNTTKKCTVHWRFSFMSEAFIRTDFRCRSLVCKSLSQTWLIW